jgi:hypothetical protein
MLMWIGQVDQPRGDTCHHCKGDTWHACTTYMVGTTRGKYADREDDVAAWKIHFGHLASRWMSDVVPRGPDMGCHVAPMDWFVGLCKSVGARGI